MSRRKKDVTLNQTQDPKRNNLIGLDLTKMFSEVVEKGFDLTGFNQIDESEIPKAPNFYVFSVGREFCNATLLPWQVEAGMHLFSEYCPECTPEEYQTELLDETPEEIASNICFLEFGVCPKCKKNRLELFGLPGSDKHKQYIKNEYIAALGQRSGKSLSVASFALYLIHRWLKEPDPVTKYNLPTNVLVDSTFTALTADQAERNLWIPFKQLYSKAPWFIRYNHFLDSEGKRLGKVLFEEKESFIFYKHKQLLIQYDGSNNSTQRGATRLFAAIDELAFFNNDEDTKNKRKVQDAKGSYAALNNSLATLRTKATQLLRKGDYDTLMPCMFNVSSPLSVNDMVMQLIRGSTTNPFCVALHRATWECNSDYTREDLRAANANLSETEFMRDFGAIPPFSDFPFISEPRVMEKLCTLKDTPLVRVSREIHTDAMGDRYLYLDAKIIKQDKLTPRLISLDNGYNNNAFALCLFRYDVLSQKPVLEFATSLSPQKAAGLNISFPMMFEKLILPLVKAFNIRNVFYDRWQSLDQIHRLRDMKIDARAYSLRYETDFLPMRQQLQSGNAILPELEKNIVEVKESANPIQYVMEYPITNLVWQALTVREVGKKLLKPQQGDDDIFRAFSLGITRFLNQEFLKEYLKFAGGVNSGTSTRALGGFMGLSRGASGGSGTTVVSESGRFIGSFRTTSSGRR